MNRIADGKGKRARVLVGEDDEEMRAVITELFDREGFDVEAVEDGGELIHRMFSMLSPNCLGTPPDAVVADLRMPFSTGLDALRALRSAGWFTPFVLITGFGNDGIVASVRELGAATVLAKPFPLVKLVECVRQLLPSASEPSA